MVFSSPIWRESNSSLTVTGSLRTYTWFPLSHQIVLYFWWTLNMLFHYPTSMYHKSPFFSTYIPYHEQYKIHSNDILSFWINFYYPFYETLYFLEYDAFYSSCFYQLLKFTYSKIHLVVSFLSIYIALRYPHSLIKFQMF